MKQATALVVDDNWYNRDILRHCLVHAGYDVSDAVSGEVALFMLNERSFDLLLLDLAMPTLNGEAVLKTLRGNPLHDGMQIIIATANPQMVTPEMHQEAAHILIKPFDVHHVTELFASMRKE